VKVCDHIDNAKGDTLISYEVLPPLKGGRMQDIFDMLDPLMEYKPPFIDVTYHRQEVVFNKRESGYYEKVSIRKRPGTVGICASIMHKYGVDAIPHLICGGFTIEETEDALIDLAFLGIDNVLALRGDAMKFEDRFIPEKGGHKYASDLVDQMRHMNEGKYLDANLANAAPTEFCIGVAGYPEKHFEAPNFDTDMEYLKKKVDAGAHYIVTQMFFDNNKYFEFVDKCRAVGITVPIIPGLKPITRKSQLSGIPRKFFINYPEELVLEMQKQTDRDAIKQVGIEWCIAQSKELKEKGVPVLHYYTMGDTNTMLKILKEVV
jgi:methylenetetrahydrofolate reductase (NADPH)